jgi:predicted nucleic acid-binding Zn ribbon protein
MIDCGGPCSPCPTCSDGIQNQAETETDCGGPCPNICQSEVPLLQPKRVQTIYIFIALVLFLILGIKLYQMIQLKILLGKRKTEEEKG